MKRADDRRAPTPSEIRQEGPDRLRIRWSDGESSALPVRALRLACACALCVDEWTGEARLDPQSVPQDVRPRRLASVGRYALRVDWSDGHDSGIYTFKRLRELAARLTPQDPKQDPGVADR